MGVPGARVECPASPDTPLPAPSTFRFLGHSTEVTIKDAGGTEVTQFNPPLKICFRYTQPELDAAGGNPADFLIQTFRNGVWESLPTTPESDSSNQVLGRACALVDHLTLFALFAKDETAEVSSNDPGESSQTTIPGVKYLPETGLRPVSLWSLGGPAFVVGLSLAAALGVWVVCRRKR